MAYGVKYTISYRRRSEGLTEIEILKKDYSGPITELIPSDDPFAISGGINPSNIYEPTIGSGASISILATPLSLLELFTADPQMFKVKAYHDSTLFWQGFINAEIFSEDFTYSSEILVPITIECNDGMAVLDNIRYKNADQFYTGYQSIGNVLANILSKLELSFTRVYTSTDIMVPAMEPGIAQHNFFQYLSANNHNYIDESNVEMSCREVLNSIFGGLGLVVKFKGNFIYIIDPINLNSSANGKYYDIGTYNYHSGPFGGSLLVGSDIGWFESDMKLDIQPSYSEIILKYNPYDVTKKVFDFGDYTNWAEPGTWVNMYDAPDINTQYWLNNTIEFEGWTADGMQLAAKESEFSDPDYMLALFDEKGTASYTFPNTNVRKDQNLKIRISMDVYYQTKLRSANLYSANDEKVVWEGRIPISIKVGTHYYKSDLHNWEEDTSDGYHRLMLIVREPGVSTLDYQKSTINNRWTNASLEVDLYEYDTSNIVSGEVTLEIVDNLTTQLHFDQPYGSQVLPFTESCFTDGETLPCSGANNGNPVTLTRSNNNAVVVTIHNFRTFASIPSNHYLFPNEITSISIGEVGGIGGTYIDGGGQSHQFGSSAGNTTIVITEYNKSTDTLTFTMTKQGGDYFGADFAYISTTAYIQNLTFFYKYKAAVAFIKNVKLEIIDKSTNQVIANEGIEDKAINSVNLTGKSNLILSLTNGVGSSGASRGAFINTTAGRNQEYFYREVDLYYTSQQLFLQSLSSQYCNPRFILKGSLDASETLFDTDLKLIQDPNLPDKAFYIFHSIFYDRDEKLDASMIEIVSTRDTIEQ
ncbi:MAG TPA: hypothetical protein VK179_13820 [Bacteroidales bacterium]|nr:hypothetical protein [Bacteroidales bacterium]